LGSYMSPVGTAKFLDTGNRRNILENQYPE